MSILDKWVERDFTYKKNASCVTILSGDKQIKFTPLKDSDLEKIEEIALQAKKAPTEFRDDRLKMAEITIKKMQRALEEIYDVVIPYTEFLDKISTEDDMGDN